MTVTKPLLNMAAYAITLILILLLGLAVLKSKSSIKDSTDLIDAAAQTANENKEALDNIDATIADTIESSNKLTTARLNSLQSQAAELGRKIAELEKKLEDPSTSTGALKWTVNTNTRKRYSVIPYPLPWHYAKKFAEDNNARLVVIEDETENEWLVETFGGDTEYWIGLTDEAEEGKWLWVNSLPADYVNWAKPEPDNYRKNQHYGIINSIAPHLNQTTPGKWNDVPGNEIRLAIIEQTLIPARSTTTTTTPTRRPLRTRVFP